MQPNIQSLEALLATLLDLARGLEDANVPLTVGGGLGLYLKQIQIQEQGTRTLLDQLPEPRATNDIDLFIRAEVLVGLETMQEVAACLERLDFEAIEGAKYFHWERPIPGDTAGRSVKLDLLVGPLGDFSSQLKTDKLPRVRPKGNSGCTPTSPTRRSRLTPSRRSFRSAANAPMARRIQPRYSYRRHLPI